MRLSSWFVTCFLVCAVLLAGTAAWKYSHPRTFDRLGITIRWDVQARVITATRAGVRFELGIGQPQATVNGRKVILSVPPALVEGRPTIPLRALLETMGIHVVWVPATKSVVLFPEKDPAALSIPPTISRPVDLLAGTGATPVRIYLRDSLLVLEHTPQLVDGDVLLPIPVSELSL